VSLLWEDYGRGKVLWQKARDAARGTKIPSLSQDDYNGYKAIIDELMVRIPLPTDSLLPEVGYSEQKLADRAYMESLKDSGWLLAGNYYRLLMRLESEWVSNGALPPLLESTQDSMYQDEHHRHAMDLANAHWALFVDESNSEILPDTMKAAYETMRADAEQIPEEMDKFGLSANSKDRVISFLQHLELSSAGGDPLAGLTSYGLQMMRGGVAGFNLAMIGALASGLLSVHATVLGTGIAFPGMGGAVIAATLPITMAVSGFYYAQGALLSVYLPLIPFIIFLIAGIGWLMAVVESMVAAPLVAIGLIWPDAQPHVLGRAEPGIMMILNLFLRPSLIILGFIASLIVVFAGLSLLNLGYQTMVEFGGFQVDAMFGPLVLEFAYVAIAVSVVKKCFDLIHQVPDKVLLWIGDRSQGTGGADEALSSGRTGTEAGFGHAKAMTEGAQSGVSQQGANWRHALKDNGRTGGSANIGKK